MVTVRIVMADCAHPSPESARARDHARMAAARFGDQVEVVEVPLADPAIVALGVGLEPTVLVGDLAVSVGTAPPAGHLLRAIEAALAKEAQR